LDRLRQGDRAAFDVLYAALRPRVFSFLARLSGRRDVAEDLLQGTRLRLASSAPRLPADTRLRPWLFTVARNLFISHSRRGRNRPRPGGEPLDWISPFDLAASAELEVRLERALSTLPAAMREVLLLVAVEGLSAADVAEILDLRPDAVRQRLSRARSMLAELLRLEEST